MLPFHRRENQAPRGCWHAQGLTELSPGADELGNTSAPTVLSGIAPALHGHQGRAEPSGRLPAPPVVHRGLAWVPQPLGRALLWG